MGGMLFDLVASVHDAFIGQVDALNAELLIACTLGTLAVMLIGVKIRPRQ